jgi:hypothetical protein
MFYNTRDSGNMSSVMRRNDFIMQNHFVRKQKTFYTIRIKKVLLFPLNFFKSYVTICDIMFFANKNKVNYVPLS